MSWKNLYSYGRRFTRIRWTDLQWPVWKILLAGAGILDILVCWPLLVQGWKDARPDSGVTDRYKSLHPKYFGNEISDEDDATCQAGATSSSFASWWWLVSRWWGSIYVGPFFCAMCVIEAIVRAFKARELALENAALDNFERKLANFYSSTRFSFSRAHHDQDFYEDDAVLVRNTLRSWTPVLSVLSGWFVLMPWPALLRGEYATCGTDTSVTTLWIAYSSTHMREIWTQVQSKLVAMLWNTVLPLKLYFRPKQLYLRIRLVVRWMRYVRFAGPMMRILFKLNDQFWVVVRTRSQSVHVKIEKAKRIARRSMMFEDIQRIESLAKVQTALASLPSQMLNLYKEQANGVGRVLAQKREQGKVLRRKVHQLKTLITKGSEKKHPSSELYDRIVDLGQELTTAINDTVFNKNLISPQTRFSVGWRMIITCALMTELCRLYISFRLSGTFQVSLTDMIRSLLSDCDVHMNKQFRRLSSNNVSFRALLRNVFRLPTKASKEAAQCLASSKSSLSNFLLKCGQLSEYTIDVVYFVDIFVWFFTGEMNPAGIIVPKPFFTRCILPGTLIQVLDHPTLPDRLPALIRCFLGAASLVGYSRVLRWGLAVLPAVDMLLLDPIRVFLFRPMDDDEWLRYTESLAIFPAMSGSDIRAAFQSGTNLARMRKHKSSVSMYLPIDESPTSTMFTPADNLEGSAEDWKTDMGLDASEQYMFGQKQNSLRHSYGFIAY